MALMVLVVIASAFSVVKTIHDHGGAWSALDQGTIQYGSESP
jgi:hypothetical protein